MADALSRYLDGGSVFEDDCDSDCDSDDDSDDDGNDDDDDDDNDNDDAKFFLSVFEEGYLMVRRSRALTLTSSGIFLPSSGRASTSMSVTVRGVVLLLLVNWVLATGVAQ